MLQDGLADALRDAAMRLAAHQHRVHDDAEIVHGVVAHDLRDAGLGIDLHLADMAPIRIGHRRLVEDMVHVERFRHVLRQRGSGA